MKREHIYYAVIGVGLLIIVGTVVWQFRPEPTEPLPPPEVVAEQLDTADSTEQRVQAARTFVRHGEAARQQVRTALEQHQRYEPEVVEPLVAATMKNRDYRSMPTLLELLEHEDPEVRGRAGAAIQKILGADFGYRANLPESERAKIVEFIRDDYEQALPQLQKHYGNQSQ